MDLTALTAAVKLLADGAKDVVAVLQPGQTLSQKLVIFENLVPDALTLAPEAQSLSTEAAALQPADYATLAGALVTDLNFTSPHAQAIIPVALKVLADAGAGLIPDLIALIVVVKNPPAPVAA